MGSAEPFFYAGKRALKFMRLWGNGDNYQMDVIYFPVGEIFFPSWVKIFPQLEATNFPVLRFFIPY